MSSRARWRGLSRIVTEAIEHGSRAIEEVQKEGAARPFAVLEAIPALSLPASLVHGAHDAAVSGTHTAIRAVNQAVGVALDLLLRE